MDLPTYTNIWRIEKRLYKLYDLRLPMPLPLVQIGVFVGIFLPWIILLQLVQVPFHAPWHVVYIVPPGVLTWLATRPVIEGKRLTELMISQIRYLTEAKSWARLTPIREPDEVAIVGRVWLRRRGVSGRVHAGRQRARKAERQERPAVAAQAPLADQSAPPLHGHEAPVRPAAAAARATAGGRSAEAQSRRPAAPVRAQQRPSLRPTPQEGTGTVSPSSAPGRRSGERWGARPGSGDPWATRVDDPRVTRSDHPHVVPPSDDPNATRVDSEDPQVTRADADDPSVTRPEAVRRDLFPPAPQRARGFPAPPPVGGSADPGDGTDRPERPAAREPERTAGGPGSSGAPPRPPRHRGTSHEPERPAAAAGPVPELAPRVNPFGLPGTIAPSGPATPGRPGESSGTGRTEASGRPGAPAPSGSTTPSGESAAPGRSGAAPVPGRPSESSEPEQSGTSPRSGRPSERPELGRPGTPAAPDRSGQPSEAEEPGTYSGPGRPEAGWPQVPASARPGEPGRSASGQSGARPDFGRPSESSESDRPGEAPADRSAEPSATEPSGEPAGLAPGGTSPSGTPSSSPGGPAGRHAVRRAGDPAAEGGQESRPSDEGVERSSDAEQSEESTPTAPVIRLVPGGRHAKPGGGRGPAAHEPPAAAGRPGAGTDGDESPSEGDTDTPSDEDAAAAARTDQIVWPARGRRESTAPRDTDDARDSSSPKAAPQGPPPGPFSRPGGVRGRSHGDEPAPREARPPAPRPPGRKPEPAAEPGPQSPQSPQSPAAGPGRRPEPAGPGQRPEPTGPGPRPEATGPGQRPQPGRPSVPPQAPAARLTPPPHVPLPTAAGPPAPPAPARPGTPPARPNPPRGWDQGAAPAESPARGVRSGPASPVRPGPLPQGNDQDDRDDDGRGLRRIFSGGGSGEGDYEQRVRTAFDGARRVVVLGCTGGAGQTVTGLMLGHTFAQHRRDRIVAVDVNPGPGAMARRTRNETRETLTSLITHAEQVTGYQMMRRYTSVAKSGLEVVAAGKNPVQALDDRDYALAMRTLDRFYSVTLLDAAAAVVARVLPYADQIVLVAPASSDAPRAVAMTFEWLDGHGYEELRTKAVTVINGVSRRSMDDVEQAESVARGRCRALVRIPWDDHLSLDRAPRNELRTLRSSTRKAYIALGGVVAGGLVQVPDRYAQQEFSR